MGCRVRTNRHGKLTLRLYWRGVESQEGTGLDDTRENRKRVGAIAHAVEAEIQAGIFTADRYLYFFPGGSRAEAIKAELGFVLDHSKSPTVKQYIDETWLPRQIEPVLRSAQARDVRAHVRQLLDVRLAGGLLADVKISQISTAHIEDVRRVFFARNLAISTVKNRLGTLSTIIDEARRVDKLLSGDPFADLGKWPRRRRRLEDINPLSERERDEILNYFEAGKPQYYPLICVLLLAGLRPSEAVALRWGDVSLGDVSKITVTKSRVRGKENAPKTSKSERTVRLAFDRMVTALRSIRPLLPKPSDHVFVGRDGHVMSQDRVYARHWRPALAKLKVAPRDLYQARHTFISVSLTHGASIKYLAEYCGTSPTMIESRYGRFLREQEDLQLALIRGDNIAPAGGENRDPHAKVPVRRKLPQRLRGEGRVSEGA